MFVGGAAGGTRIRTALVGVLAGVLDEGIGLDEAIARPRFHPAGTTVNAEPGVDEDGLAELERRGWRVRRWDAPPPLLRRRQRRHSPRPPPATRAAAARRGCSS